MSATAATLTRLLAWRPGGYLRASGVLFGWLALRTLAQTALFVLVARTLGAEGYGSLIAVMAVASFFAPLAGLGATAVMLREAARVPADLPTHLGDALRAWAWTTPPLVLLAFFTCVQLLPHTLPVYAITAIMLADVACASLMEMLARAYQALGRMNRFGALMTSLTIARLGVLTAFLVGGWPPSPAAWALLYGAASIVTVTGGVGLTLHELGLPHASGRPLRQLSRTGFPFSFAGSSMRVQAEVNKPILARLDSLAGAGAFSAAQRFVDLIQLPLAALVETLIPRVYRATHPLQFTLRLGFMPLALATAGGLALVAGADLLPWLLGSSFEDSVVLTYWLSGLPALVVLRTLLTIVVGARGQQRYFLPAYTAGSIAAVALTAAWVPPHGMLGAIAATYCTEALLIALMAITFLRPHE